MARLSLSTARWFGAACLTGGFVWACSSNDTNLFDEPSRGGQGPSGGTGVGGTSGASSGASSGGVSTGGATTGGATTGGASAGGASTGGTTGDGGAAAEGGTDTGGTATGGAGGMGGTPTGGSAGAAPGGMSGNAGGGMGGTAGTPAMGGAGVGGAGMSGAGTGGSGGSAGTGGKAGKGCKANGDCTSAEFCKKTTCAATDGRCAPRGPDCAGDSAAFDPVCGCDGITYFNSCVIEHEGFNVAMAGECTGSNRPTCTRTAGGDSCPTRLHAHCYRPVDQCGDPSPTTGVCWVLPAVCPPNEAQDQRYCGGTAGSARCIGLCEVIDAENSFDRDAPACAN